MPRNEETGSGAQKKIVHASERQTDRVRLERWLFTRHREQLEPHRLIFFDESGINLSMARRYGRGLRGARVEGFIPKNWGESVTLIAGIGRRGLFAPLMLDGSMTGDAFDAYIEQAVVPHIHPGDVLVWDNLSVHKRARVRDNHFGRHSPLAAALRILMVFSRRSPESPKLGEHPDEVVANVSSLLVVGLMNDGKAPSNIENSGNLRS